MNIDRNRSDFLAMQRQLKNFQITMVRGEHGAVADLYGAHALPYLLMVDKAGPIARTHKGYSEKLLDGFVTEINALLDESDDNVAESDGKLGR